MVDGDGIYNEKGEALEYSNITGTISEEFTTSTDTMSIYIFVKNTGDRYIIPQIALEYDPTYLGVTEEVYFFDKSAGNIDPLELKVGGNSASSIVDSVASATKNEFPMNAYIDNDDTYMLVLTFGIVSAPGVSFETQFRLNIAFMADVQYDANNEHLLTVSQPINQMSPAWTKVGYNATLNAEATKVETHSATTLKAAFENRDTYGNTDSIHNLDDYLNAVVYKDIDIVNVDIKSGEIIGKLSDVNYPFEWYGGDVTLPSGTTLASGRVLTASETFTVDCYTYYPTFYFRRWMVNNVQYITISDEEFVGSTRVDERYVATFESTIFNPDTSVATDALGAIIVRSYSCWWTPLTNGSASYLQTYYNFGKLNGSTDSATQEKYLIWTNNLTKAWVDYATANPMKAQYITAVKGVQGENWYMWAYTMLYLVKYADNHSQEMIGYGNTYTYNLYRVSGATVTTPNGVININSDHSLSSYASQKGGGVIGLKGEAGNSAGEGLSYDSVGMAYAYNCSEPMYSQEFLTYCNAESRVILDGYVGSNKYTGVWCLGKCNPWGNVWIWVFGAVALHDENAKKVYAYVNFDNFSYDDDNYMTQSNGQDWQDNDQILIDKNYYRLNYNLPTNGSYYRYNGICVVDSKNGIQTVVGLPTVASTSTGGSYSYGLCDNIALTHDESKFYGMISGGSSIDTYAAGIFMLHMDCQIGTAGRHLGFRSMLV